MIAEKRDVSWLAAAHIPESSLGAAMGPASSPLLGGLLAARHASLHDGGSYVFHVLSYWTFHRQVLRKSLRKVRVLDTVGKPVSCGGLVASSCGDLVVILW